MDLTTCAKLLDELDLVQSYGQVSQVIGLVVEGKGIKAPLGAVCEIIAQDRPLPAEVIGFRDQTLLLMPYDEVRGIAPGCLIKNAGKSPVVGVSEKLLGRVIDGLGNFLDQGEEVAPDDFYPLYNLAPEPLERSRIVEPLDVGIRCINGFLTIGKGQRIGIMAGSGVGKSTLMGMIARYTNADVNVIALVGERGRELREFIEKDLGESGLKRSVVVVATSDKSPLIRMRAAYLATSIAEFFRDRGKDVLLMMDSVTRFAMAAREVGLSAGEPPTTKGYTPSVFAQLPRLLERAGKSKHGSITGIYTVLVDGDDFNEPIADAVRSILDGHIVLTRELADQGHYPAIDVLKSISRLRSDVTPKDVLQAGNRLLALLAAYKRVEDMINIGAYTKGSNPEIDQAISLVPKLNKFLQQPVEEKMSLEQTFLELKRLAAEIQ